MVSVRARVRVRDRVRVRVRDRDRGNGLFSDPCEKKEKRLGNKGKWGV
jgi:hypothetical protein